MTTGPETREIAPEEFIMILRRINFNRFNLSDILRLFQKVRFHREKDCWLRGNDWSDYSTIVIEGVVIAAHRFSYSIFNGSLRFNNEICHECDIRGCINPEHLWQGTHSENMQDARDKGRIFDLCIRGNDKYRIENHDKLLSVTSNVDSLVRKQIAQDKVVKEFEELKKIPVQYDIADLFKTFRK